MKNIAVFYHIKPGPPINPTISVPLFRQQMSVFESSGLLKACNHSVIGVNGKSSDLKYISAYIPNGTQVVVHGEGARSELPTLNFLQKWLPSHEDWYVCYWHAKGITHQPDRLHMNWRKCMERAVIQNWKQCVQNLDSGMDSAGAHWLTPERFGAIVKAPFWGGNFWWSKASFLLTLPKLRENSECREQDFDAESWIGWGPRRPRVKDYAPHWPHPDKCAGRPCFMTR